MHSCYNKNIKYTSRHSAARKCTCLTPFEAIVYDSWLTSQCIHLEPGDERQLHNLGTVERAEEVQ